MILPAGSRLIETYTYYDRPLLYSSLDQDHLYLVVLETEAENYEQWMVVELSVKRYQHIRNGIIDLYAAFKKAELGYVTMIEVRADKVVQSCIVQTQLLTDDQLPKRDEVLLNLSQMS